MQDNNDIKKKIFDWMDRGAMFSHILLIVVGGYLLYAMYRMMSRADVTTANPLIVYLFSALFLVIGIVLIAVGAFALITGHYREKK